MLGPFRVGASEASWCPPCTYHVGQLCDGHFKMHSDWVRNVFHGPDELVIMSKQFVKEPLLRRTACTSCGTIQREGLEKQKGCWLVGRFQGLPSGKAGAGHQLPPAPLHLPLLAMLLPFTTEMKRVIPASQD